MRGIDIMSASSKKKLRNEQAAEKLTQRQLAEQKEAKKLKGYTIGFCAIILVLLILTVSVLSYRAVTGSGFLERNTTAATIGNHKLSHTELNYYYIDAINNFTGQYGSYLSFFGMDPALPLNQQVENTETGATWADYFIDTALNNAATVYAMSDAAKEAGHALTEAEKSEITNTIANLEFTALTRGFPDAESYLKALYGNGANMKTYRQYLENNMLAQSYYTQYAQSLTYDDAALRAAEAGKEAEYNNYTYSYYTINVESYLHNDEEADTAEHSHSAEDKAAAQKAAEADAKALTEQTIADAAAFDKAIAAMENLTGKSTLCDDYAYSSVTADFQSWVTDSARKPGDMTYVEKKSTSIDENGAEVTEVTGYYVILFTACNDNKYPLVNVRHILVSYEGGTTDATGNTVYSPEDKLAAEVEARKLLQSWEKGEKTEDAFAALANQHSDDGDGTTGGLYTDVYPGQMVPQFNDWCFDESRKPGDTGIVNTTYGSHVMFYSGDSETLYRDYLIREAKRSADVESWYNEQIAKNPITKKSTKYVETGLILSTGY
jgi:hypothetical protein